MISYLTGKIFDKTSTTVTLMVGGVGYEVHLAENKLSKIKVGEEISFFIYTHVREDIFSLYGFEGREQLTFFKMLLSVSGIGPKVALSIIGSAPIEKIKNSIVSGDPSILSAVSGVGKKTAQKAVIELRNKLGAESQDFNLDENDEVLSALISLGFEKKEIAEALAKLPENFESQEDKIKGALKIIGKKK